MSVVQAFDPNTGEFVAIEVASGEIIARKAGRFVNKETGLPMEECEPLEKVQPERRGVSDPLGAYR